MISVTYFRMIWQGRLVYICVFIYLYAFVYMCSYVKERACRKGKMLTLSAGEFR